MKCIHQGAAPCGRCARLENQECTLTETRLLAGSNARKKQKRKHGAATNPAQESDINPAPVVSVNAVTVSPPIEPRTQTRNSSPDHVRPVNVEAHLGDLSSSLLVQAVNGLTGKYPELAMIHLPTLLKGAQRPCPEQQVLVAAILAAYTTDRKRTHHRLHDGLYGRKVYENYAEELLSTMTFSTPHIQVVQALLIVALLKGGSFELHKAWMYCGKSD